MKEGMVDIMDVWLDSRLRNVHTMIPGKIEKYYGHTTRKARVKAMVKLRTVKGTVLEIPPIDNVPVIFPSSTRFSLLFPLRKGDGCAILFSEEGIGAFLKGKIEVTADSLARFSLTDAVCIPGLFSFRDVPSSTGTIEIDNDGNIDLNSGTKGVARTDDLIICDNNTDVAFEAWRAIFNGWAAGLGLAQPMPQTRTGKITGGSSKVVSG